MKPLVFNIQKFSIHDGPGIRTTFFFKGCPIRCQWCHNPESQRYEAEPVVNKEGREEIAGKYYSVAELIKLAEKDLLFYEASGGGVTFSGGEPMTQDMDFMEAFAKALDAKGIPFAIDTCGVAPREAFMRILPYTSLFLYDLKCLDSLKHAKYTGAPNDAVLANLQFLSARGARVNLRLVLLEEINSSKEDIGAIAVWLKKNDIRIDSINLLPYHEYGRNKYCRMGREYLGANFRAPAPGHLRDLKRLLEEYNHRVVIGGNAYRA